MTAHGGSHDGNFSIVLYRKFVGDYVHNMVLEDSYSNKEIEEKKEGLTMYDVPFILDVNGDQIMDIFVEGQNQQEKWLNVYEIKGALFEKVIKENLSN